MATLSLKISLENGKVVKTMQFDPSTTVYDACRIIRDKILEANMGEPKDYGLFLTSDEDSKKGIWLEPSRTLEHYILRNGDVLEFNKKLRNLRVRMLDGSVKTMLVDDSQVVANLMVVICTKIGITNYDEYSLVREDQKEEQDSFEGKPNTGTLTLKRKNQEKDRDVKMDQLRKKLRTDDEVNWVDPAMTLREQGVDVNETLLLRRKFFFSDRNVDSRDPVQLNLLYVQARDAILDTTHPITQEKACEFAGIQCQIQFGDHKENHTTGILDPEEFLPRTYSKVKGIEKKIFKEHKKHTGLSELEAKVLYTKTARSLKTYGVAFFLVKEKMKGKNKLVPRLLGVTKDSVLRLDEKTKEILQTWPLTTVRRWCASPNTFTLDFGDYSDQYYSVQTTEAEQILQVIAGYIDIILKKQRAKDHFGIEGDEGSTMLEDSVSPSKAQILQHESTKSGKAVVPESLAMPAVLRAGGEGPKSYAVSHVSEARLTTKSGQINIGHTPPSTNQTLQVKTTSVLTEPQRALLSTISSGREIIRETESHLVKATLPVELGHDTASLRWKEVQLDTNKQVVTSQIAAMNAATAQVVTLTSGPTEEVDHTAVGAAITTITSNLPEMTKGVQMIAALLDDTDNGDKLLDATRKLCNAFSDLLKAAEPETKEPRQSLLNAASRVGEASTKVLYTIGEETEENKEIQDILLSLAKAVANTTAALVLKAKNVAANCKEDPQQQNRVIAAATHCALATSQLVACAKVVAPTLHSPACREQLTSAARAVSQAVEALLAECRGVGAGKQAEDELRAAAAEVTAALSEMLQHVNYDRRAHPTTVQETSVETVMTATDRLITSQGDPAEMVKQARLLGQATAQLITNIKTEAEQNPQSDQQRRLLAAAKLLADATARMVEAARQCASSPQDRLKQEALRKAAEELRYITVDYAQGQDIVTTQVSRLQDASRQVISATTQLITSAHNAGVHNTNKHSQEALMHECKVLQECTPRLVEGVKAVNARPDQASAQLELITASESFLQPSAHVAQAARAVLPTVNDGATAKQLSDTTHQFTSSCTELRAAVNRARVSCKGLELDAAAEVIRSLQKELDEVEEAARAFDLKPLPGETAEWASQSLANASRNTASSVAKLVSSLRHNDAAGGGQACGETAHNLREFVASVRCVAAADSEPQNRERVIDSGRQVLTSSLLLVETAKRYLTTSERIETTTILTIAKNISHSLEQTVEAVPTHKDLDIAMENINETLNILSMGEFPPSDRTYGELQQELNMAAEGLNSASSEIVQTVDKPAVLAESGRGFGDAFDRLLGVSMEMAGQQEDHETRTQMLTSMRSVTISSSRLLGTAKSVSQDLTQPNARNRLAAAARAVTDSINNLVDVCTSAAPGQKECDKAVRSIQSTAPLLNKPSQPLNDLGYFGCLDAIVDQSKTLSEGMSGMANAAKRSDHDQFTRSVRAVAESICGLVECTAQSAYLVAVSDETSVAGRPGLVDQAQFARASQAIEQACEALSDSNSNQQQVLSAATVIAKYTSALCNACRFASGKTPNPQAKRHFVQAAKDVANSTAALVKEIKALDNDYSEANRNRCAQATGPLLDAVHSLCQFANSPEFASVPAKISTQARKSQEAILESGRMIIKGSCSMVESAKILAVQPTDKPQWQSLATHSKTVSDSIKALVNNIRDKAPGQRECLAALETLNSQLRELDKTSLQAVQQNLTPRKGNTLQGYSEQIESSATEILERLEPLRTAAKSEAENLGHAVVQLVSYIEPTVQGAIGAASNITESSPQMSVLEQTKTVVEGVTQLVLAAKDAGGNPRAISIHPDVDEQVRNCRECVGELMTSVTQLCTQQGLVGGLLDSVSRSIERVTSHRMSLLGAYDETDSFVDYQTRMFEAAKEIARLSTDMTAKAGTDAGRLAPLAGELTQRYAQLAQDSVGAAATTPNSDVAHRLRTAVVECGEAVTQLIRSAGQCQLTPGGASQRAVADNSKLLKEKVGSILSALQAGSKGTQACIDAAATVSAIIGDLDTTILFASAGTLHAENDNDTFSERRESILKTAKSLVEDTKTLVSGAAASQDQLAEAAQSTVNTIVQLAEVVKLGAMSLGAGNPDSQVLLIHAVRDVAAALRDLIHTTKDASGKHITHPSMERMKESARVMVTNVTSLLKTVKSVEDEHTRGTRALESTIEAISQEIRVLLSSNPPRVPASPEELVRCTRQMTVATARAVAAGNSGRQDDVTAAANQGRKAVSDMLAICKGAAYSAETTELRERTLNAGHDAATAYRELLQAVLSSVQGVPAAKQQFPDLSRRVAQCVADIIATAELLKGSDWVDPDDPTVIAENELLGAAASIDAAANKLAALRPRRTGPKEADETLNFDEMILEAAKSIIAATSALVRAASAAQRELIDQGKVARRPTSSSDDGQWSEGLISAARMVAAAAHSLVEAANALVQGLGSEEKLISSAKQVASSTAHLLVACKVKADPSSESTRRLQSAGAEVIRSTDNLVRSARDAIQSQDERSLILDRRMVGGIAQEIDARSEVLRIEKELEEARGRLTAIRQAKYKIKTGDMSGDETELDYSYGSHRQDGGYTSDSSGHRFAKPSFGQNSSYGPNTTYSPNSTYGQNNTTFGQNTTNYSQHSNSFGQNSTNYAQSPSTLAQNTSNYGQNTSNLSQNSTNLSQNIQHLNQAIYGTSNYGQTNGNYPPKSPLDNQKSTTVEKTTYTVQSPSFSSFRPSSADDGTPKQNYEGFTTRYETRLYDTPRAPPPPPPTYVQSEEQRHFESSQFSKQEQKFGYDIPKPIAPSPLSPKFNARDLKFDIPQSPSESLYSTIKKPGTPNDGFRDHFTETRKSTENIPGGKIESEYTIKSESYKSYPKTEFSKMESVSKQGTSPFLTSTPSKYEKSDFSSSEYHKNASDYGKTMTSTDLVKAVTPDFSKERISSPYGKETYSYGGPNYKEESSTEVKEIPNGTQRITTTKIYSSSPVQITTTNTKYEPVKLEGIDELSKSFDNDSRYSTLDSRYNADSRFNTLDSKLSSDTSRSFMRPSDFQQHFESTTVSKVKKPTDLVKDLDTMDKKFSKQTISKEERVEKKTVMTSSHKSETSQTVTKKFGNY